MSDSNTEIVLTKKQRSKIQKALDSLDSVRLELELEHGVDVGWYLEDTANLNLMQGQSHDDRGGPNFGMVIERFDLPNSSGGGW